MQKSIFLLSLALITSMYLNGQNSEPKERFIDNVRFGGGINMGFGSNHSFFTIAPGAIYDFSEYFSSGLSFKYMYFKNKSIHPNAVNIIGGSILALYRPGSSIQLSAEFERLKKSEKQVFQDAESLWQSALFFGFEYVTGNIALGLRYDVLYDKTNLIYPSALSPVFRVYF
jgi:hypothetical protein